MPKPTDPHAAEPRPETPITVFRLASDLSNPRMSDETQPRLDRALTVEQAEGFARHKVGSSRFDLRDSIDACWRRLARAPSPEVCLSYQRLITALTQIDAWIDWQKGRTIVEQARAANAETLAAFEESQALARWHRAPIHPIESAAP